MISRSTSLALVGIALSVAVVYKGFAVMHNPSPLPAKAEKLSVQNVKPQPVVDLQAKADRLFANNCSSDPSIDCLLKAENKDSDLASIGSRKL